MKTIIKVNGKKISRKSACERFGSDKMKRRIKEAEDAFRADPHELSEWMDGMTITFDAE